MDIALTGSPATLGFPARAQYRAAEIQSDPDSEGFASHLRDFADDQSEASAPADAPKKEPTSSTATRRNEKSAVSRGRNRGTSQCPADAAQEASTPRGTLAPGAVAAPADQIGGLADSLKEAAALSTAGLVISPKQADEGGKPGEMAFAVKVKAAAGEEPAQGPNAEIETNSIEAKATPASFREHGASSEKDPAEKDETGTQDGAGQHAGVSGRQSAGVFTAPQSSERSDKAVSVRETSSPVSTAANSEATATNLQEPAKNSGPLKELSISVGQLNAPRVDVRIVERAGELHVAVRAGEVETINALRQNLAELSQRLAENGYKSETWHAGVSAAAAAETGSTNTSTADHHNDSQNSQDQPQQDGGRRNQDQSAKPRWVEELESSSKPGPKNTGEINGITN